MRTIKLICFLLMAAIVVPSFAFSFKKKKKEQGVYLAGIAASFTDSVVYITNVQLVDSAGFDDRGLLIGRVQYSLQLKDYLTETMNLEDRTCLMFFSKKKKKVEKSLTKLRQKYQKGGSLYLKDLPEFRFTLPDLEY